MKRAFTTAACPSWDLPTALQKAGEYGYTGLELRAYPGETTPLRIDPLTADAAAIKKQFEETGIEIACLATSLAMSGRARADTAAAGHLRACIERAQALACPLVKINNVIPSRVDHATAAVALADWLAPLADCAAEHQVTLLIENELSFRQSYYLWRVLETLNHPSVAACWDVGNAMLAGERPALSVPTLNSRIQYVHIKDVKLDPAGPVFCPVGRGDVPIRYFLARLQGIGYDGWVTVDWDRASYRNLGAAEEILPGALSVLRGYLAPPVKPGAKAQHPAAPKGPGVLR